MERSIDLQATLKLLKNQIVDEKQKLDYMLKGAELLAEMLVLAAKENETGTKTEQHHQSGLEEKRSPVERNTL